MAHQDPLPATTRATKVDAPPGRVRRSQPRVVPPRWVARAGLAARRALLALADAVVPAQLPVFEQGAGLFRTQLLRAAARLRVADLLERGPRSSEDLARATGVHPDALHRALRALAAGGVFRLRRDGLFENTRLSRALRADATASMRDLVQVLGSRSSLAAWADFEESLRTGDSAFERVHGMDVWAWLGLHDDERRTFSGGMASLTEIDAPAIASGYPFSSLSRVCDVAGGRGALLAAVLQAHARPRGVLLDAPAVVADAPAFLAARGVAHRVECVGGSFFEAVPSGCDAYLLKDVLHDWDDPACLRILETCRRAAPPGARALVAEILVTRRRAESPGALVDVQMMTMCVQGRQRSAAEHHALMARAGFAPGRVFPLAGPVTLVEGVAR